MQAVAETGAISFIITFCKLLRFVDNVMKINEDAQKSVNPCALRSISDQLLEPLLLCQQVCKFRR